MIPTTIRKIHKWAFVIWTCVGLPISIYLRNSVAWVMVLSIYTILIEHLLGWRQERDKEKGKG